MLTYSELTTTQWDHIISISYFINEETEAQDHNKHKHCSEIMKI